MAAVFRDNAVFNGVYFPKFIISFSQSVPPTEARLNYFSPLSGRRLLQKLRRIKNACFEVLRTHHENCKIFLPKKYLGLNELREMSIFCRLYHIFYEYNLVGSLYRSVPPSMPHHGRGNPYVLLAFLFVLKWKYISKSIPNIPEKQSCNQMRSTGGVIVAA